MMLDISAEEMVVLSAGLGLVAEASLNPRMVATMSQSSRTSIDKLEARGQWPSPAFTLRLLNKLVARLQVEVE